MPYKSLAQERWAHTKTGLKALGGAAKVAEWDSASKGMKFPRKVKPSGGILSGVVKKPRRMK
jgi:hypothetical protein